LNSQKKTNQNISKDHNTKRNRSKSVLIIAVLFGSVIGIVILSFCAMFLLSDKNQNEPHSNGTYIFYEPDYDYDIMTDEEYLELDRQIYFKNQDTGITTVISKDNLNDAPGDQKEYIALLCDFIDYAINGESDKLNALFSQEYIDAEGKLKIDFTMQQLYNIRITYIQTLTEEVDGEILNSCDYWLEYKIRKNNGTFRNDMESDCIREEYVRITQRDDRIGIDVLSPYTTRPAEREIIQAEDIILISIVAIVTLATFIAVSVYVAKKKK
jgi:hypothetical protein